MFSKNIEETKRGSVMLKPFIQTLRKSLWGSVLRAHTLSHVEFDQDMDMATTTPTDVKEGCFAVVAVQGKETQRFVIDLEYLKDPAFLSLLEQAREEYGFHQKGALLLPCRPRELQKILEDRRAEHESSSELATYNVGIIEGY